MTQTTSTTVYNPKDIEQNWYNLWEQNGYFKPVSSTKNTEAKPYSIVIPPPNVTGSLHMGHAFQYTLMDILIRVHRMDGYETLWQMGTDAAGIATQMVVERQLNQKNIKRTDLTREEFVDKVWEWKGQSGGRISQQIRRLGASVDWSTEKFTMDESVQDAVNKTFVELYDKGLIYRGNRLVNWDPVLHTALSDLEVENIEKPGFLWHIKYQLVDSEDYLVIATTRPETLLGDTAVAVNPNDPKYTKFIGKKLQLPLTNRQIPIIADDYVDLEFGTGAVKITPAHDFNDFEVGKRHNLEVLNIFTVDAKINNNAPAQYQNLTREQARKAVLKDLEQNNLLVETKDHTLKLPIGDRSGTVIEPYLVPQWYIKVEPLAEPAKTAVNNKTINFVPENYINMYNSWMNDLQDWCISRQLWWGNRIPAWYDEHKNVYVAATIQDAIKKYSLDPNTALTQDPDTLDTWFAASLWPAASLGWPDQSENYNKFYPTNVLITGFDIIFFWVARMIMMGLHFNHNIPFKEVYFTGLIRDGHGQKMSKSKGNIIDPLDLIDGITLDELVTKRSTGMMQDKLANNIINQTKKEFPNGISSYGTDALRFTLCALASQSRNINFDLKRMDGYRNFCNKLWNASRFVFMNTEQELGNRNILNNLSDLAKQNKLTLPDLWILSLLQDVITKTREHIKNYRFDLLAQNLYEFVWDQYCDWYLELSKVILNSCDSADPHLLEKQKNTRFVLLYVLEQILKLLHPIIPFITEELWQKVYARLNQDKNNDFRSIMLDSYPVANSDLTNTAAEDRINFTKDIIVAIRNIRGEMNVSPAKVIPKIYLKSIDQAASENLQAFIERSYDFIKSLSKADTLEVLEDNSIKLPLCASKLANNVEILIPMAELIDVTAEAARLDREISKLSIELEKLSTKLSNETFVTRAPEAIVAAEKARLAEMELSLQKLKEKQADIKNL